VKMDKQELKKILATLSIAGLLTSAIPLTAGCTSSTEGSCTGDKKGAQTEKAIEEKAPAEETPAPGS
jgi:radical SAM modification target selenobiotic family peptide